MKENIWILNHYATSMFRDHGGRHYWFAKYLLNKKYKPTIFCASTIHNSDEVIDTKKKRYISCTTDKIPFVFINTPPYKGNGIKRIFNMMAFYKSLFCITKEYADLYGKPDIILASSVHPLTLVAGIKIAKKMAIPCICEIRDLWPEGFIAYGLLKQNNLLARILYHGEKWIYIKADKIIFTMEGGKDYIVEKGWDKASGGPIDLDKVYHINNGVDLDAFNYNKEHYQIEDPDLENKNTFKVIYTGSIRMVNKVALLLDAAKILQEKGVEDIKFLIWGDGNERKQLEARVKEENLTNVSFKGRVDKNYIPYITSRSQLNIALGETLPLYSFGGSLNKMFDYFAAGKPVLFTFKLGYSIIDRYGAGLELSESSPMKIVESIVYFKNLSEEQYSGYCENAKRAAKEYNFEKLTERLIDVIGA
jgi:glycosyltransferase involved in cell wall biosynthesis